MRAFGKKREVGKSDIKLERLKLESLGRSWKVWAEVGKFGPKLESSRRSWKVRIDVGKFGLK